MSMVRLSKEHGLNPSITTCFYCGKDSSVILAGAVGERMAHEMGYEDGKMPMHCGVVDMTPCRECADYMKQGIIIIGIEDGEDPNKDINVKRTGHFVVVVSELFENLKQVVKDTEVIDRILESRWTFMESEMMSKLGILGELEKSVEANKED